MRLGWTTNSASVGQDRLRKDRALTLSANRERETDLNKVAVAILSAGRAGCRQNMPHSWAGITSSAFQFTDQAFARDLITLIQLSQSTPGLLPGANRSSDFIKSARISGRSGLSFRM